MEKNLFLQKSCSYRIKLAFSAATALLLIFSVNHAFGNFAYVANVNEGTVSVIDTSTNTVINTISTGLNTGLIGVAITPDGDFAYVTDTFHGNVYVIQTSTNTVIATVSVGGNPKEIAITPNGNFAYVVNHNGTVAVIRTSDNSILVPSLTVGSMPLGIAITPNGNFAYVSNNSDATVSVIRTSDNMVIDTITVGAAPFGVAVTPDGAHVYVAGGNEIDVIRTSDNMISATISVGDLDNIAITPDGNFAYVTDQFDGFIYVIQTSNNTVVGMPLSFAPAPLGVAITPDGKFVYVTSQGPGSVYVIQTSDNTLAATISMGIGSNPQGIAITPSKIPPNAKVGPPSNITGSQKKNDFGLQFEFFNVIQWDESPSSGVRGYNVYRNGSKIATLDASTLTYQDDNRKKGRLTQYSVTAFDSLGLESEPISITIN